MRELCNSAFTRSKKTDTFIRKLNFKFKYIFYICIFKMKLIVVFVIIILVCGSTFACNSSSEKDKDDKSKDKQDNSSHGGVHLVEFHFESYGYGGLSCAVILAVAFGAYYLWKTKCSTRHKNKAKQAAIDAHRLKELEEKSEACLICNPPKPSRTVVYEPPPVEVFTSPSNARARYYRHGYGAQERAHQGYYNRDRFYELFDDVPRNRAPLPPQVAPVYVAPQALHAPPVAVAAQPVVAGENDAPPNVVGNPNV